MTPQPQNLNSKHCFVDQVKGAHLLLHQMKAGFAKAEEEEKLLAWSIAPPPTIFMGVAEGPTSLEEKPTYYDGVLPRGEADEKTRTGSSVAQEDCGGIELEGEDRGSKPRSALIVTPRLTVESTGTVPLSGHIQAKAVTHRYTDDSLSFWGTDIMSPVMPRCPSPRKRSTSPVRASMSQGAHNVREGAHYPRVGVHPPYPPQEGADHPKEGADHPKAGAHRGGREQTLHKVELLPTRDISKWDDVWTLTLGKTHQGVSTKEGAFGPLPDPGGSRAYLEACKKLETLPVTKPSTINHVPFALLNP